MRYVLKVRELSFTAVRKDPWFEAPSYMSRVLSCFRKCGWMSYFHFLRSGDSAARQLSSEEEVLSASQRWGDYNLYLLNRGDLPMEDRDQPFAVSFYPWYRALVLTLAFNSAFQQSSSDITVSTISEFMCCLYNEFEDALFGPEVRLWVSLKPYPRLWPPREAGYWTFGNLMDFYSRRYWNHEHKDREEAERIFEAEVPEGVTSWWCTDDLRVVQWVNNLQDEEHLLERRALQERWLVDLVDPPIDSSFTHLLDEARDEDPYLTYYQKSGYNNGYKVIEVGPDGSFDRGLVAQLVKWKEEKQLPDGRKVRKVYLLVQSLTDALRIYDPILKMGIDNVFYFSA